MKRGMELEQLAKEINRRHKTKKDYMARTTSIHPVVETDNKMELILEDTGRFGINDIAHGQIAEHTGIPARYYERMRREAPELLANNVAEWFEREPATRMVRTLDGNARAFLSNSFRPLDNFDFAGATLPVLAKRKLEIMSCDITDKRLYIKAVDTQLFKDVPVGYKMGDGSHRIFDTCAPAIVLSNSEVGYGRLVVETGVYTRACTNLALFSDGGMKKTHLGARHGLTDGIENIDHLLSARTKQKTDEALWLQVRDVVKAAFDKEHLTRRVEMLAATAENKITGRVDKVVEVVANKFGLNEGEHTDVLQFLIEGGNLSQYGLHAAITRAAAEADNYDRATEMEYLGGKIIELPKTEWEALASA